MYQFTEDCHIGVATIDAEHEHLFSLINQAYTLLNSQDTNLRMTAQSLLQDLKDYAHTHFAHEEAYMKEIGDPELSSQMQEHANFVTYINTIHIPFIDDAHIKPALESILNYLSHWLFRHIISSDTLIGKFESPFAFTSKYMTGIELIDEEHKRLFEIIKDVNAVIHAELLHDKYDEIMRILEDLKEYTRVHFQDEEAYMERIGYEGLPEQKKAHTAFIAKFSEINLNDLDDHQQEYLKELIQFLLDWLSKHILIMDKKIPN